MATHSCTDRTLLVSGLPSRGAGAEEPHEGHQLNDASTQAVAGWVMGEVLPLQAAD